MATNTEIAAQVAKEITIAFHGTITGQSRSQVKDNNVVEFYEKIFDSVFKKVQI